MFILYSFILNSKFPSFMTSNVRLQAISLLFLHQALKRIVTFGKSEWTGERAVGSNLKIRSWRLPTEMEENHPDGQKKLQQRIEADTRHMQVRRFTASDCSPSHSEVMCLTHWSIPACFPLRSIFLLLIQ